jgi:hypothetical protein
MNAQLSDIIDDFEAARQRLHRLAHDVPADAWAVRADPGRWSVAECVEHLNLTSRAYLPLLEDALARARRRDEPAPARFRRDLIGWLLWKTMSPPVRHRVRTTAAFVPAADRPATEIVAEFERLQDAQVRLVKEADGLPIHRVRIASPFSERVRYNVYSAFTILPAHQHRHLWQAEQIR